jgi:hypothetical protein
MSIFKKLLENAQSEEERKGFMQIIRMMLVLRKHKRLKSK